MTLIGEMGPEETHAFFTAIHASIPQYHSQIATAETERLKDFWARLYCELSSFLVVCSPQNDLARDTVMDIRDLMLALEQELKNRGETTPGYLGTPYLRMIENRGQ